jgi:serine/threonine protein kinase
MSGQASSEEEDSSGSEKWSTRGLPRRLGRYELMAEIGTGGMASVFLARTTGPGRFHKWVAVKRIHPHLARDKKFVEMFLDEARLAAAIQHPNVAQVFDLGEEDEEYFLAMEYLEGEHLGTVASHLFTKRKARFPLPLAARIVAAAANGLHNAHEAQDENGDAFGMVHRDVSPHNIFVSYAGDVKVMDFGVAKAAGRITTTETGGRKGKLAYMSPEQLLNEGVDRRTDIFALGVVLWEISLARRLFRTDNDAQTITKILQGTVPAPTAIEPSYPFELEQIVLKCLARSPADRYATAQELAIELEQFEKRHSTANGAMGVAGLMKDLFPDRIEQKKQMLRAATAISVTASSSGGTAASSSGRLSAMAAAPRPELGGSTEVTPPPRAGDGAPEVSMVAPSGTLSGMVADLQGRRERSPLFLAMVAGVPVLIVVLVFGAWSALRTEAVAPAPTPASATPPPPAPTPEVVAPTPPTPTLPLGADLPEITATPDGAPAEAPVADHGRPVRRTPTRDTTPPVAPPPPTTTTTARTPRPTPPEDRAPAAATTHIQILALGTWAHVRIDGHEVGQTPYNGEVTVGGHSIELLTDDGRTFTAHHTATEGVLLRVTHRFE